MKLYFPDPGMTIFGNNAIEHLGFELYDPMTDTEDPAMFWCYFPEDYEWMLSRKGKTYMFWHGSDVMRLKLNEMLWEYIPRLRDITHACHSELLQEELAKNFGIYAAVRPTFWNDVSKYPESYEYSDTPEVYISSHPNRDVEYGEGYMRALSIVFPDLRFHIYGNDGESTDNLIYHGAVTEHQMDLEIKDMQICLRMNEHDGMSQTAMKAIFMRQYLITKIDYGDIPSAQNINDLIWQIGTAYRHNLRCLEYDVWIEQINNWDWI